MIKIETELGIPLQELAIELIPLKQKQGNIIDLLDKHPKKVEASVKKMVADYIKESKVNASVINIEFIQMDSDNLNHGAAYFTVTLKGNKTELKKIASNDMLFVYDWENQSFERLSKNSQHNLTLPNNVSMLDGNNKNDMKKENDTKQKIEVKKPSKPSNKFNPAKYADRDDDLNPTYMFSTTATVLLSEALKAEFDIKHLLRRELSNRGLDVNGKWIGFDKAKEMHKV